MCLRTFSAVRCKVESIFIKVGATSRRTMSSLTDINIRRVQPVAIFLSPADLLAISQSICLVMCCGCKCDLIARTQLCLGTADQISNILRRNIFVWRNAGAKVLWDFNVLPGSSSRDDILLALKSSDYNLYEHDRCQPFCKMDLFELVGCSWRPFHFGPSTRL